MIVYKLQLVPGGKYAFHPLPPGFAQIRPVVPFKGLPEHCLLRSAPETCHTLARLGRPKPPRGVHLWLTSAPEDYWDLRASAHDGPYGLRPAVLDGQAVVLQVEYPISVWRVNRLFPTRRK